MASGLLRVPESCRYDPTVVTNSVDAVDRPLPDRSISGRGSLLRDGWEEIQAIGRFRSLLRYLVSSSLKAENAGTVFGFLWWMLHPLLLMAIYWIVVDVVLRRGGPDYPIFVLTAILSWEFFARATQGSVNITVKKEQSMRQVAYPRSLLPLSTTLGELFHFTFGFVVLLLVAIPFGIYPSFVAVLVLPIVLVQLAFTLGVAFVLSALNMFFRDTANLMRYMYRGWFYLSPALYAVSQVPQEYRFFYELNPFATFFIAYRSVVMNHSAPDFAALGLLAAVSILLLVAGYLFFVRLQPSFAKLIA